MTKIDNILNNEEYRKDSEEEFPEIKFLGDFLKSLQEVIECTEHSDDHTQKEITPFKRYQNTLHALFGKNYSIIRKPPSNYSYQDMRQIKLKAKKTDNLEGAIKDFLTVKLGEETDMFHPDFGKIKEHLYKASFLYEGESFEKGIGLIWNE